MSDIPDLLVSSYLKMIPFRHQPPLVLAGSNAALVVQPQPSKIPSIPIRSPLESEKPLANHHLKSSRRYSKQAIQTNNLEQVASISYNRLKVKRRHRVRHSQRRPALRGEETIHPWASYEKRKRRASPWRRHLLQRNGAPREVLIL
jgi:hypothetical protein